MKGFGRAMVVVAALTAQILPCSAAFLEDDLYVPAVARGAGSQGSQWYTTVWFYNPGPGAANLTVSLLLRDQANLSPDQQVLRLPEGSTLMFRDAIVELFGVDSAVGALRVQSTAPVVAGARVYNQINGSVRDSQGQLMPGIPAGFAIGPGQGTDVPGVLQPQGGDFRSNFGLVETSGSAASVEVTLFDRDGTELASQLIDLAPYSVVQRSIAGLVPAGGLDVGSLRVRVVSTTGAVVAYGSAVANGQTSQDPTTLEMNLDPSLLGGGSGGDITGVVAGPGLEGGGSQGEVTLGVSAGAGIDVSEAGGVAIAAGGVTASHIASGQLALGLKVGSRVLRDVITLEGDSGIAVTADDNIISIAAAGPAWQRLELPVSASLTASPAGAWKTGSDRLQLPSAGVWRVGYRVVVQVRNAGVSTSAAPVNLALVNTGTQEVVRGTMSVVGLQLEVGYSNSQLLTVSGETVIHADGATSLAIAGRTSTSDMILTIQPHAADLDSRLPAPDGASFLYAELVSGP